MRAQKPRILIRQEGCDLAFCHLKFRKALSDYVNKQRDEGYRITQTELIQDLADHLHLSQDSINNYKKGHNGPASIGVVRDIAAYLGVEWIELMKEVSPMAEKKIDGKEMAEKIMTKTEKKSDDKTVGKTVTASTGTCQLTEFEKRSAWNAVREVYKALLVFVMFFEGDHSVVLDLDDSSADPIIRSYNYCRTILHKNMLDIPDNTYEQLHELIGEMQYWIYGLPDNGIDEDSEESNPDELTYFRKLYLLELNDEFETEYSEWAERVTAWVVDEFYMAIRHILKNYIPREPAARGACPQTII